MISWLVGERCVPYAVKFINDLASRLAHRVQLTTDGHKAYLRTVEGAFGADVDYAMLERLYVVPLQEGVTTRYSPAQCCGTRTHGIAGNPDAEHISTSYAERMNLQIRRGMRRVTRLRMLIPRRSRITGMLWPYISCTRTLPGFIRH